MKGRAFWAFSVLAICALLVGCGSSSGGSTSSGSTGASNGTSTTGGGESTGESGESSGPPSFSGAPVKKAEFIKQGDAICQKVPERFQKLVQGLQAEQKKKKGKKASEKQLEEETNLKAGVPPLREAAEEFEQLGPPTGEEDKAVEIVEALEAAANGLEEKPSGPLAGPGSSSVEFSKLTKKYGFKICWQL